jgi:hypothetical protein
MISHRADRAAFVQSLEINQAHCATIKHATHNILQKSSKSELQVPTSGQHVTAQHKEVHYTLCCLSFKTWRWQNFHSKKLSSVMKPHCTYQEVFIDITWELGGATIPITHELIVNTWGSLKLSMFCRGGGTPRMLCMWHHWLPFSQNFQTGKQLQWLVTLNSLNDVWTNWIHKILAKPLMVP